MLFGQSANVWNFLLIYTYAHAYLLIGRNVLYKTFPLYSPFCSNITALYILESYHIAGDDDDQQKHSKFGEKNGEEIIIFKKLL